MTSSTDKTKNYYNIDLSESTINQAFYLFISKINNPSEGFKLYNAYSLQNSWHEFTEKAEYVIWNQDVESTSFKKNKQKILSLFQELEKELIPFPNPTQDNNNTKQTFQNCLSLFQELEQEICMRTINAYYSLPYFMQFFNIATRFFQASIVTNTYDKKANSIESFFNRIQFYLKNTIEAAFVNRCSKINIKQYPINKELVYIYDDLTKQELTKTTNLQPNLLELQEILRNKIANNFIENLPINHIINSFSLISGNKDLLEFLYEFKNIFIYLQPSSYSSTENIELITTLVLPNVKEQYFPDIIYEKTSKAPAINNVGKDSKDIVNKTKKIKIPTRDVIKSVTTATISSIINNQFKVKCAKIFMSVPVSLVGPIVSLALDLLFPTPAPITKEEIIAEIDARIRKAIDAHHAEIIKAKFRNSTNDYLLCMQDMKNNKEANWATLIHSLNELKEYFFIDQHDNNYDHNYYTCQIFSPFASMYLVTLYTKLLTAKPNDITDLEQSMLKEFFIGWYLYFYKR